MTASSLPHPTPDTKPIDPRSPDDGCVVIARHHAAWLAVDPIHKVAFFGSGRAVDVHTENPAELDGETLWRGWLEYTGLKDRDYPGRDLVHWFGRALTSETGQ